MGWEGMTQIKLLWKVMDHLLATKGHQKGAFIVFGTF